MNNIIKDTNGNTIQWTDTKDNCTTKILNNHHIHICSKCGTNVDNMKFIKETGYEVRVVTMKCKCETIVKYYG